MNTVAHLSVSLTAYLRACVPACLSLYNSGKISFLLKCMGSFVTSGTIRWNAPSPSCVRACVPVGLSVCQMRAGLMRLLLEAGPHSISIGSTSAHIYSFLAISCHRA